MSFSSVTLPKFEPGSSKRQRNFRCIRQNDGEWQAFAPRTIRSIFDENVSPQLGTLRGHHSHRVILDGWRPGRGAAAIMERHRAQESDHNVCRARDEAGLAGLVPPAERVATFDNDGTLWAEQPLYFQVLFAIDRVKALAPQHPEWKDTEPFGSLLKGDLKAALGGGEHALLEIVMAAHAGMTTDEFDKIVQEWIATAKHPTSGRPYTDMAYRPMLELLAYLRENGFKTFIVSGGDLEFMRSFAEKVYGIPPEQVIGSTGKQKFERPG